MDCTDPAKSSLPHACRTLARSKNDASLANALLKLADGFGPEALDPRETFAVMCSPPTLASLAPLPEPKARQMKDL